MFTSFDCLIFGLFQAKRVVPHLCSLTYGAHIWWHFPWITQVKAIDAFRLRNLLSETDREKKNSIQMFERVLWVCPSVCCLLRMIVVRLFSFFLSLVLFTPFPCISYWSNNDNDKNSNNNQTQSKSTEANSSNWNTCTQHCFMWSFVCLKTNCLNGCTDGSLAGLFVCLTNYRRCYIQWHTYSQQQTTKNHSIKFIVKNITTSRSNNQIYYIVDVNFNFMKW